MSHLNYDALNFSNIKILIIYVLRILRIKENSSRVDSHFFTCIIERQMLWGISIKERSSLACPRNSWFFSLASLRSVMLAFTEPRFKRFIALAWNCAGRSELRFNGANAAFQIPSPTVNMSGNLCPLFPGRTARSEVLENRSPVLSGVVDPAQHSCLYLADATWRVPSKQIGSRRASRRALHLAEPTSFTARIRQFPDVRGGMLSIELAESGDTNPR